MRARKALDLLVNKAGFIGATFYHGLGTNQWINAGYPLVTTPSFEPPCSQAATTIDFMNQHSQNNPAQFCQSEASHTKSSPPKGSPETTNELPVIPHSVLRRKNAPPAVVPAKKHPRTSNVEALPPRPPLRLSYVLIPSILLLILWIVRDRVSGNGKKKQSIRKRGLLSSHHLLLFSGTS
jgi:hypothetical protein